MTTEKTTQKTSSMDSLKRLIPYLGPTHAGHRGAPC